MAVQDSRCLGLVGGKCPLRVVRCYNAGKKALLKTHLPGSHCVSSVSPSATGELTSEPVRELHPVLIISEALKPEHPLFWLGGKKTGASPDWSLERKGSNF